MIAAPALMPLNPFGEKPPVAGLCQLIGLISVAPTAQKKRMIAILRTTIALLELADSRMPMTRMTVISATMRNAGRLKITGRPKRCGAPLTADARYSLLGVAGPVASACTAMCAER